MTVDLEGATRALAAVDADWAGLIARIGPCRWQPDDRREPYEALVRSVAFQQIHGRAAAAILERFLALYPGARFPAAESIMATESSLLRAVGFSAAKITAIRAIAAATLDGTVPGRREAVDLADEALIERLGVIRGVGRWTVEMMLMHTLGRADIFPVGDFGVREGWRVLRNLPHQPTPGALAAAGMALRPYRSVAAWYLWRAAEEARRK